MKEQKIDNFMWWLNTSLGGNVKDNQLTIARNVFYNQDKQIETRRGIRKFGNPIWSSPITSYFFFQKDDGTGQMAICSSGTQMYRYDPTTSNWSSIKTNLHEYELKAWETANRTRRDYGVYKNIIYMCNGVDQYAKYDGTTYTETGNRVNVAITTVDHTTDTFTIAAHWLTIQSEIWFQTAGTLPVWVSASEVYYVINPTANTFQVSLQKSGTAVNFTSNGSGTINYYVIPNPRVRYVSYLWDRIFGAGDDNNPNTLYYTNAAPLTADDVDTNLVVVGGDEMGKINGLGELGQVILTFKSNRIYSVDVTNQKSYPLDAQSGGYADRSINNVWNSIVFYNERGLDTLQQRTGVTGSQALDSKPISDDIRSIMSNLTEWNYNASVGWYIKKYNNFYIAIDRSWDNIPDTVLVYSSLVWAWTQYDLPSLYDFGFYINASNEYQYLFASASGGQMFEFEYGYEDDWLAILYEVQTKVFDFWVPWKYKTYSYIDIVGQKSLWTNIDVSTIVEWETTSAGQVTDSNIQQTTSSSVLWLTPISEVAIWWWGDTSGVDMYRFTVRLPLYTTWPDIAVNLSSIWGQRILEQMRIWVNWEPIDVFSYGNIL